MPVTFRPGEDADVSAMAAIRAQQWGDKTFWTDRLTWYLRGEHSPQHALPERAAFVTVDEGKLVGFVAGHSRVDSVAEVKQKKSLRRWLAAEASRSFCSRRGSFCVLSARWRSNLCQAAGDWPAPVSLE
jgi:hypothetical protein